MFVFLSPLELEGCLSLFFDGKAETVSALPLKKEFLFIIFRVNKRARAGC